MMLGIKELIENFCKLFEKTILRLTFCVDNNDPQSGTNQCNIAEDYDINRICGELLELPWHPGRVFEENDIEYSTGENRETYVLAQLDDFDKIILSEQSSSKNVLYPVFSLRFPLIQIKHNYGNSSSCVVGILRPNEALTKYLLATDQMSAIAKIESKKERIKALKSYVIRAANWGKKSNPIYIETLREYRCRKLEENREELEAKASVIALKYKCSKNSIKFIAALHKELAHHRSQQPELNEDGLCATVNSSLVTGTDQWCGADDEANKNISTIYKIIDWLKEVCPLLWAKYQEKKLRRKESNL